MEIRNLKNVDIQIIFDAFEQAFSDYEVEFNKEQVRAMLKRRGFNSELSFAAFEGHKIISFTLNGVGSYNDVATAYDTGTGTLKAYRGKGMAQEIFKYSIPYLKEAGIKQYLLEVLQHNPAAISVYTKLGFKITREFNYFRQEKSKVRNEIRERNCLCKIEPIEVNSILSASEFCDFYPSWQNSLDSIKRAGDDLVCLGAFTPSGIVGYCVVEPNSGDLTQIAVDHPFRRKGVAAYLFEEALHLVKADIIKILNTDISCSSITSFLQNRNINVIGRQYEMINQL